MQRRGVKTCYPPDLFHLCFLLQWLRSDAARLGAGARVFGRSKNLMKPLPEHCAWSMCVNRLRATQELTTIQRQMEAVKNDASLKSDAADRERQRLLNAFYVSSGNAKAAPAADHINLLLTRGGESVLCLFSWC